MIMANCESLHHKNLSLYEIQESFFDVNLTIIQLLTNFYIKNEESKHTITKYSNVLNNSKLELSSRI